MRANQLTLSTTEDAEDSEVLISDHTRDAVTQMNTEIDQRCLQLKNRHFFTSVSFVSSVVERCMTPPRMRPPVL